MTRQLELALRPVKKVDNGINPETGKRDFSIVMTVSDGWDVPVSKVSERYTLLPNRDLIEPFVTRFGEPTKVINYSQRRSYMFEFNTGKTIDMGGGDILTAKAFIGNSYDKSRSYTFVSGAFRHVCSNGVFSGVGIALRRIHVGTIPLAEIIAFGMQKFGDENFDFWKRLKGVNLTHEQELKIIQDWEPFEFKKDEGEYNETEQCNKVIRWQATRRVNAPESLDNQRNAWGLFNQMNWAISSFYKTPASTPKRILGDKRIEQYLAQTVGVN
jgi:hypothetical protein